MTSMRRVVLLPAILLSLLAWPLAADAQPAKRVPHIGALGSAPNRGWDGFSQRLRELGYMEGKNIVIEHRFWRGDVSRLQELAAELSRLNLDVIVAGGDQAIQAVKAAGGTIPIVMLACDAVEAGFVTSLVRPGGRITGVTCLTGELAAKRLELLREVQPRFSNLSVLYNPGDPHAVIEARGASVAARVWKARVQMLEVRQTTDFDRRFSALVETHADALFVAGDSFTLVHAKRIVDFATRIRVPAIYAFREFVDAGGLMAYGTSLWEMGRAMAGHVDKILKGAKPGDLPVEQPTKFELVINLKTAKALGLTIPPSLLLQADEVIQ
jgi:putative ABC transport system substrate-binding protein